MKFAINQKLVATSIAPCSGHSHDARIVHFRRDAGFGYAEVFTCRGSQLVSIKDLVVI